MSQPPSQPPAPQGDQDHKKKIIVAGAVVGVAAALLLYKLVTRSKRSGDGSGDQKAKKPSNAGRPASRPRVEGSSIASSSRIVTPKTPMTSDVRSVFNTTRSPEENDVSQWDTFTSNELGISFKYPPFYVKPEVTANGIGSGYIIAIGKEKFPPVCLIAIEQAPHGSTMDGILEQQQMMMTMMGLQMEEKKTIKIGDMDARAIIFSGMNPQNGQKMRVELQMFQKQNRIFTMRPESNIPSEEKSVLEKIISSITAFDIDTVGTLSFHSARHNLDIDLPTVEYVVKDPTGREPFILYVVNENPTNNTVVSGIKITSKPKREYSATLDLLAEGRKKKLESRSEFSEGSEDLQSLTICGQETRVFEYVDTLDGNKHRFMEILFVTEDHSFIVTLFSLVDKFSNFRKEALKCLESIKIDESATGKREKDTVVYTNPTHKFSIEVDNDVSLMENLMTDPIVTLSYLKESEKEEEARMFQTLVTLEDNAFGNNIEAIRDNIKQTIQQQSQMGPMAMGMGVPTIEHDEVVKINGRDAIAINFNSADMQMGQTLNIVHFVPVGDKIFTIKSQTLTSMLDKNMKMMIDKIHNSFKTWN